MRWSLQLRVVNEQANAWHEQRQHRDDDGGQVDGGGDDGDGGIIHNEGDDGLMVVMMLMTVGAMMMMVVMVMMTAERINYMMPLLIDTWPICLLNPCDAALQQSLKPITTSSQQHH